MADTVFFPRSQDRLIPSRRSPEQEKCMECLVSVCDSPFLLIGTRKTSFGDPHNYLGSTLPGFVGLRCEVEKRSTEDEEEAY